MLPGRCREEARVNLYYNVIQLALQNPGDARSWLVKVAPDGTITRADGNATGELALTSLACPAGSMLLDRRRGQPLRRQPPVLGDPARREPGPRVALRQHLDPDLRAPARRTIGCVDTGEHPNRFQWSFNAPAVDRHGTVYAVSEDGYLYVIDRDGQERERVFLTRTQAGANTPVATDHRGRIYVQNDGELFVLGH
jgi:hypothetical protein